MCEQAPKYNDGPLVNRHQVCEIDRGTAVCDDIGDRDGNGDVIAIWSVTQYGDLHNTDG